MALIDAIVRAALSPLSLFLIAASIASLPAFIAGYLKERRLAMIDEAVPILLRRVASKMRSGIGLEQALVEGIKEGFKGPLGLAKKQLLRDPESLEEFLGDISARYSSQALSLAISVLKVAGEVEAPPEEVLEGLAEDIDEANRIRLERVERARGVTVTSLSIATVLLPAVMGLTLNFLSLYSDVAKGLIPEMRMMVIAVTFYSLLFSGVMAGAVRRYLLLTPAAALTANLILEASAIVEVL